MALKILHDEVVHEGRFVRLVRRHFLDRNGDTQQWEMVNRRTHGPVVAVAALTAGGCLVLNRIWRVPLQRYVLELPAGLMDRPGEDPQDLARRELLEETGYAVGELTPIMRGPYNTGLTSDELWVYGGMNARRVSEPQLEPAEDIHVLEVPTGEVEALLTAPPEGISVDIKLFGVLWWLLRQRP